MEHQETQVLNYLERRLTQLVDSNEENLRDSEFHCLRKENALLKDEISLYKRRLRTTATSSCIGMVLVAILSTIMTAAIYQYVILTDLPLTDLIILKR